MKRVMRQLLVVFTLVVFLATSFTGVFKNAVVHAKDAEHAGTVYLDLRLSNGTNQVSSKVNREKTGDAFGGQDYDKAPQGKQEDNYVAFESWAFSHKLLQEGVIEPYQAGSATSGSFFNSKDSFEKFDTERKTNGYNLLTLTFPGWGAGDSIPDLSKRSQEKWDRRSDTLEYKEFVKIDKTAATAAASAVDKELVQELNRAIEDFVQRMEVDGKSGRVRLTGEGLLNVVFLLANGYLPKETGTIKYNSTTYTIDTTNLEKVRYVGGANGAAPESGIVYKNGLPKGDWHLWHEDAAGTPLVKVKPSYAKNEKDDLSSYTYAVSKGYTGGVGQTASPKYATDLYVISWMDLALSLAAKYSGDLANTTKSDDNKNTTVVGDQVGGLLYDGISGLLGVLGIQDVDSLVFGEGGNLFKNGVFEVLVGAQAPFALLALMILVFSLYNAWRISATRYLSVGEVQSINGSLGRVANAIIMILLTPLLVTLLVYVDQFIVKFAFGLNQTLSEWVFNDSDGFSGFARAVFDATIGAVLLAVLGAWVNVKFTFRYLARAISFGLYFITAPIVFALDALQNGRGGFLEFGPNTGEVWKNLIGLILQRSIDALGIAIAINLGRLIFGPGILVTFLGLLTIESITNAIMQFFGVRQATVKGIQETAQSLFKKGTMATTAFAGAVAGQAWAKSKAAVQSGKNQDAAIIAKKKAEQQKDKTASGSGNSGVALENFDQEVRSGNSVQKTNSELVDLANKTKDKEEQKTTDQGDTIKANKRKLFGGAVLSTIPMNDSGGKDTATSSATGTSGNRDHLKNDSGLVVNTPLNTTPSGGSSSELQPLNSIDAEWSAEELKGFQREKDGSLKERSLFGQGFFNKGVYGDKNTTNGRFGYNDDGLNPDNYTINEEGNVVAANWKGRLESMKRSTMRGTGAVLSTFVPNSKGGIMEAGRTLLGATAAATSTLTPGRLDNWIAASLLAKNYETTLTGGRKGTNFTSNTLSGFVGRMAGVNPQAFEFDRYQVPGYSQTEKDAIMQKQSELIKQNPRANYQYASSREQQFDKFVPVYDKNGAMTMKKQSVNGIQSSVQFNNSTKVKEDAEAFKAMETLTRQLGSNSQFMDKNGVFEFTPQDVQGLIRTKTGTINESALSLATYAQRNGVDKLRFDGTNLATTSSLTELNRFNPAEHSIDSREGMIANQVVTNGEFRDQFGAVYKQADDGSIVQYGDAQSYERSQVAAEVRDKVAAIQKDSARSYTQPEKAKDLHDVIHQGDLKLSGEKQFTERIRPTGEFGMDFYSEQEKQERRDLPASGTNPFFNGVSKQRQVENQNVNGNKPVGFEDPAVQQVLAYAEALKKQGDEAKKKRQTPEYQEYLNKERERIEQLIEDSIPKPGNYDFELIHRTMDYKEGLINQEQLFEYFHNTNKEHGLRYYPADFTEKEFDDYVNKRESGELPPPPPLPPSWAEKQGFKNGVSIQKQSEERRKQREKTKHKEKQPKTKTDEFDWFDDDRPFG